VSDIKCQGSGVKCNMPSTGVRYQCQGSGVKYNMSSTGIRYQVSGIRCLVYTYQGQVINMSVSGELNTELQHHILSNHPVMQHDTGE